MKRDSEVGLFAESAPVAKQFQHVIHIDPAIIIDVTGGIVCSPYGQDVQQVEDVHVVVVVGISYADWLLADIIKAVSIAEPKPEDMVRGTFAEDGIGYLCRPFV